MGRDGCEGCKHVYQNEHLEPCFHCEGTKDGDHYKSMTNADRIRGMNDYEMAELFDRMIGAGEARSALVCEDYCSGCAFVCKKDRMCEKYDGKESYDAVIEWLQSEVEESDEQ